MRSRSSVARSRKTRRQSSSLGLGGTVMAQTRGSPRCQAISVRSSVSPSIASVLARRWRRGTAIEAGSTTWLSTPLASSKRWIQKPSSPTSWIATTLTGAAMRCSARVFNRARRSSSLRPSPPTSVCLDIFLLPGASDVATQVERLSSKETNKVAESPRMAVRSGNGRSVLSCIGRFLNSVVGDRRLTKIYRPTCIGSVFGRSVRILTMMQSYASAAKLRAAGPFSPSASVPCQLPVPATSDRQSTVRPEPSRERRIGKKMLFPRPSTCRTQDDALQCFAGGDKAPKRDEQLACQRDNHRLARASTAIGSAGLVPSGQCALLLKPQKAPGELDHAAADPGVAGSGEPLFPPLRAALVRRARQAGVARHRFAVTHWPREHLIDQHVCRFNADADDPNQVPYHGVWLRFALLLQSFLTSLLDLLDLSGDEAQPRYLALQLSQCIWRQRRALRGV